MAASFLGSGYVDAAALVHATLRYLTAAAEAGVEIVVMDTLIPYVPSLLAFGYSEARIATIIDELAAGTAGMELVAVFLDGDPWPALARAAAREDPRWLGWYAGKLARYGLLASPEPDLDTLTAYLTREREITLRVLLAQPWPLLVVDRAHDRTPADILAEVTRFLGTPPPPSPPVPSPPAASPPVPRPPAASPPVPRPPAASPSVPRPPAASPPVPRPPAASPPVPRPPVPSPPAASPPAPRPRR